MSVTTTPARAVRNELYSVTEQNSSGTLTQLPYGIEVGHGSAVAVRHAPCYVAFPCTYYVMHIPLNVRYQKIYQDAIKPVCILRNAVNLM